MKEFKSMVNEVYLAKTYRKEVKAQLKGSGDSNEYFRKIWEDDLNVRERFYMLTLNRINNVINWNLVSVGGTAGTVIDIKMIAKVAIDSLAAAIILGHNHPSGNLKPSDPDQAITSKLKTGLGIMDINVLDHIILTPDSYFSFADEGIL